MKTYQSIIKYLKEMEKRVGRDIVERAVWDVQIEWEAEQLANEYRRLERNGANLPSPIGGEL